MSTSVRLVNIVDDGTNIFTEAQICDGPTTSPFIRPVFPTGTATSEIDAYFQAIADGAPTMTDPVRALVGKLYTQA